MTAGTQVQQFKHGRVPREVRREQILGLAGELFSERGYAGASMEELCRRAGVTKPVVYDLFGSKEGLYLACVESSAEQLADTVAGAVQGETELEEKLRAGGLAFLRFSAEHRVAWDVLFLAPDGRFAGRAEAIRRRQAELVATLLAEDAAPGVEEQQLEVFAEVINGAFEAVGGWASEHPDVPVERLADWLVELFAPGLKRFT